MAAAMGSPMNAEVGIAMRAPAKLATIIMTNPVAKTRPIKPLMSHT
jgi:hypothetical protein